MFKDLNLLKKHTKNQEASSILRVVFALSKWPHLHRESSNRPLAFVLSCSSKIIDFESLSFFINLSLRVMSFSRCRISSNLSNTSMTETMSLLSLVQLCTVFLFYCNSPFSNPSTISGFVKIFKLLLRDLRLLNSHFPSKYPSQQTVDFIGI